MVNCEHASTSSSAQSGQAKLASARGSIARGGRQDKESMVNASPAESLAYMYQFYTRCFCMTRPNKLWRLAREVDAIDGRRWLIVRLAGVVHGGRV